jgi:uncharacterized membrane-anchored protein
MELLFLGLPQESIRRFFLLLGLSWEITPDSAVFIAFFALLVCLSALRLAAWPPGAAVRREKPDALTKPGLPRALADDAAGGSLLFLLGAAMLRVLLVSDDAFIVPRAALHGVALYGAAFVRGCCAGLIAASLLSAFMRPGRRIVRIAAGAVLAALTWLFAPLGPGMGLLLYARSRGSRLLAGAAAAYLGTAVTLFYYQMDVSFPQKSRMLALSGLLLLGLSLAARGFRIPAKAPESGGAFQRADAERAPLLGAGLRRKLPFRPALLAALLIILGAFNASVFSKENLIRHGRIMLLELEPVDPLSLLQGYYMRLDLKVEEEIGRSLSREGRDGLSGGRAVLIEREGISRFARLHEGEPLAEGEALLAFRTPARGRVRVGGGSFFFEEGSAGEYDRARYAELRVSPEGEALIVELRDAARRLIRPAAPPEETP